MFTLVPRFLRKNYPDLGRAMPDLRSLFGTQGRYIDLGFALAVLKIT
jgi:hypothetical protein